MILNAVDHTQDGTAGLVAYMTQKERKQGGVRGILGNYYA